MISDLKVMKLAVQSLMNKMNLSLDETLTLLDYPQDTQAELRKLIQEEGKAG
ncbi:MAG: hypothetical protein IKE68_06610 [Solobacterium sp.]|nr:hypothetical protein [Solobacterium sp.]